MPVKIRVEGEPIAFALRRLKKTLQRAGILKEAAKREFFVKPSEKRRHEHSRRQILKKTKRRS